MHGADHNQQSKDSVQTVGLHTTCLFIVVHFRDDRHPPRSRSELVAQLHGADLRVRVGQIGIGMLPLQGLKAILVSRSVVDIS